MTDEDLNPGQEAEDEKSAPNPDEGSESEEMSDEEFKSIMDDEDDEDDSEEKEEESEDKVPTLVEDYNKEFGTDFKSLEAMKESQKNLRAAASDKGRENKKVVKEEKGNLENEMKDRLLSIQYPESIHVEEDLREESERSGLSKLDIFEKSSHFQKEAAARAEEENVDTSNSKKINTPDTGNSVETINFKNMSSKQFKEYQNKVMRRR